MNKQELIEKLREIAKRSGDRDINERLNDGPDADALLLEYIKDAEVENAYYSIQHNPMCL